MQFAYLNVSDTERRIVDGQEYQWLTADTLPTFEDGPKINLVTSPYVLVYGGFLPQPGMSEEEAVAIVKQSRETIQFVLKEGVADDLALHDLEAYEPISRGQTFTVPVAALIQAPDWAIGQLESRSTQAVVAMRRYSDLGPLDTVLNRSGVFAFAALEKRQKAPVSSAFWRESVDAKRAIKVASGIR